MKAVVREKLGSLSYIELVEKPKPKPTAKEVLIAVKATNINRTDCAIATGKPYIMRFVVGFLKPRRSILGTDFAGEVVEIGSDVTAFKVGDRVMGFDDNGICSQAEFMTMDEQANLIKIPEKLNYTEAAACNEATHYAYSWIKNTQFKPTDKVLINGTTGAIGSALLQFVKSKNVFVTAVCNTKNVELIEKLGADKIYDYQKEDFTQCELKYDYVFDAVGKSTYGKCKRIMKPKAIYLSSELGPYWQNPFLALFTKFSKGKKVLFPIPSDVRSSLAFVVDMVEHKNYKPVIEKTVAMDNAQQAYEYVDSGAKTGNVVLLIRE